MERGMADGMWEVMAMASSNWQSNVNELERLRAENNSFKEKEKQLADSGMFSSEDSRIEPASGHKRKAEGEPERPVQDIWGEFESMMMKNGGNVGYDYTNAPAAGSAPTFGADMYR